MKETADYVNLLDVSNKLYEKAYSCLDIIMYIENNIEDELYKCELLILFNKIKSEFRDESFLMYVLLVFFYLRSEHELENITII